MTADNCATMFVKLQVVSHRGFDKKMKASFCGNRFQDVFDLHDSAGCMTCLNLVIMSEKTWIVLLGQSEETEKLTLLGSFKSLELKQSPNSLNITMIESNERKDGFF